MATEIKKHDYCEKTIELEHHARRLYLNMGERLFNIRNDRLYEPAWSSWQEFCMEFKDLSISSISKMISVYEVFILKYGFSPEKLAEVGGWTKLYALIPLIGSKSDAKEWLDKSALLTRQDLTKAVIEASTGVSMSSCKHPNAFLVKICPDCGDKEKVY